jgi:hypothetical protein
VHLVIFATFRLDLDIIFMLAAAICAAVVIAERPWSSVQTYVASLRHTSPQSELLHFLDPDPRPAFPTAISLAAYKPLTDALTETGNAVGGSSSVEVAWRSKMLEDGLLRSLGVKKGTKASAPAAAQEGEQSGATGWRQWFSPLSTSSKAASTPPTKFSATGICVQQ